MYGRGSTREHIRQHKPGDDGNGEGLGSAPSREMGALESPGQLKAVRKVPLRSLTSHPHFFSSSIVLDILPLKRPRSSGHDMSSA